MNFTTKVRVDRRSLMKGARWQLIGMCHLRIAAHIYHKSVTEVAERINKAGCFIWLDSMHEYCIMPHDRSPHDLHIVNNEVTDVLA